MALIHCPECRNEISDQASACPKCGYPVKRDGGTNQSDAARVRQVLVEKGKIAAIKLYRESKPGLGLAEAKVLVDRIEAELPPGQRKAQGCLGLVLLILVAAAIILGVACTV
jgi:ribosomal protein L7/L12